VPNFPYVTSGTQPSSEAESGAAAATAESSGTAIKYKK